ncbi:pentatricopeptide repeat protein [Diplodia corticola]|uniref:Pentatricopeptide repeat protein n=1 Tax=Diplodia corticola TaxID=236234 RepID=A0A1J9S4T9_9PEZI|nr:pentatricopeptide repeat protein [Diplodia corticola]OJD34972.1 pentatricopeptide repeat protein [Diplodia corticola]
MPSNPIAHHAGTIRGNVLPVLPFLAPRAFKRALPPQHMRRWMTAAVASNHHRPGPPRTARFASASDGEERLCRQCAIDRGSPSSHAPPQRIPRQPFATFASRALFAPSPPRPRCHRAWISSRRPETRFYSTSEEDYLVEEDEERAVLEGTQSDGLPLEDAQFYTLMNAEFRELRRLDFLITLQGVTPTEDVERLLKRAAAWPLLDGFPQQDVWWIKKFAQLNAIHDVRLPVDLRTSRLEVNAFTEQAVKKLLCLGRDAASIRQAWASSMRMDYSPEGKRNIWCEMMLWLLDNDQGAVLPTLEATGRGRKAPDYVIADILEQFMSNHLQGAESGELRMPSGFLSVLAILLKQRPFLGHTLSQKLVHLTLAHSSLEQGTMFWDLLQAARFRASWHTLYQVAYFFGKHGEYNKALAILRRPIELGAPPTHPAFLATCAQILRNSAAKAEAYSATAKILSELVGMGVSFNIYLYTVTMHNAVDHGDLQSALTVYRLMQHNGVEPNDYTYTVLLKGLKDNAAPELLQSVMRDAERSLPKLERPRIVATDILHCVYLQHCEPACTEVTFADLARIYRGYFNPSALIKLGVPTRFFGDPKATERTGMKPPPAAIGIMLAAYLKLVSAYDPEEVGRLYRVFYDQIEHSGDHGLAPLGQTDYFFNAFILALGQNASTLPMIPEVLWRMSDSRLLAKPLTSKYTWDILVNAFMRHNQPEAAERVLEIMDKYGQQPNDVTWNSFVRWYARRKDVERVLDTIRRMQLQRVELSVMSLRALGRLKDRDKLAKGLRELDELRHRQADEEADYLVPDDYREETSAWQNIDEEIEDVAKEDADPATVLGKRHDSR